MSELFDEAVRHPGSTMRNHGGHSKPAEARTPRWWVVVEILDDWNEPTVVADGRYPRNFATLKRMSIAPVAPVAQKLKTLIARCASSRRIVTDRAVLQSGVTIEIAARPIHGPYGEVRAVAVWAGVEGSGQPPPPRVGVVEWDASMVVAMSDAARSMLLGDQSFHRLMLPELVECFDRLEDRSGFLELFSLAKPADKWAGSATSVGGGTLRQLHLAARTCTAGTSRVRALVCDLAGSVAEPGLELYESAMRHVPVPRGHAFALVDLDAMAVHDWRANEHEPIAGWRHHQPQFHPEDLNLIVAIGRELLDGTRTTARLRGRLRFHDADDWIAVEGTWTRLSSADKRQAFVDVAAIPPVPTSVIDTCPRCLRMQKEAC